MTPEERAAMEERADKATQGPWYTDAAFGFDVKAETGRGVAKAHNANHQDADFIAHARTDVPALLAALAESEAKREAAEATVERVRVLAEESLSAKGSFLQGIVKADAVVAAIEAKP